MSLIRVRRSRKRRGIDTKKGSSPAKLMGLLLLVIVIIWYLSYAF